LFRLFFDGLFVTLANRRRPL